MKFKDYLKETDKTWNKQEELEADLEHALLGLLDEAGELASAFKKKIGYGKELDLINVKEELGDGIFFLTRAIIAVADPKHMDKMIEHIDGVINTKIPDEKLAAMKTYSYVDLAYNLNKPIGRIYEGMATKDDIMIGQAISDVMSAYSNLAVIFGFTVEECMEANVAKLQVRYKGKEFSEKDATVRDLKKEKKTLSKK